jgi:hypothetical protein
MPVGKGSRLNWFRPYELALADFARHLSLSARQRTAGAYLDSLQRLLGFGLDPLQAERGELERFLSRNRPIRARPPRTSLAITLGPMWG